METRRSLSSPRLSGTDRTEARRASARRARQPTRGAAEAWARRTRPRSGSPASRDSRDRPGVSRDRARATPARSPWRRQSRFRRTRRPTRRKRRPTLPPRSRRPRNRPARKPRICPPSSSYRGATPERWRAPRGRRARPRGGRSARRTRRWRRAGVGEPRRVRRTRRARDCTRGTRGGWAPRPRGRTPRAREPLDEPTSRWSRSVARSRAEDWSAGTGRASSKHGRLSEIFVVVR